MIFTVGKRDNYEKYISEFPEASKAIGGSVWQTREQAQEYAKNNGFSVYGVEANWDIDTIFDKSGDGWNELLINAPLVKLD